MEDMSFSNKGKRTKRLRFLSPSGGVVSSCSSGENGSFDDFEQDEEDLANCLILLAQGGNHKKDSKREKGRFGNDKSFDEIVTASTVATTSAGTIPTKVGLYIYECKTCNRTFPSFQALGGHRASHKRPKIIAEEKKLQLQLPLPPPQPQSDTLSSSHDSQSVKLIAKCEEGEKPPGGPTISFEMGNQGLKGTSGNNKAKIHECSICGSEFTSGQALGGHMRRHRTSSSGNTSDGGVRPRNILQLDLNLPAPEEDVRELKFQFPATQKSMVMSAPALVGCHY